MLVFFPLRIGGYLFFKINSVWPKTISSLIFYREGDPTHRLTPKPPNKGSWAVFDPHWIYKSGHFFIWLLTCDESSVQYDVIARRIVRWKNFDQPAATSRLYTKCTINNTPPQPHALTVATIVTKIHFRTHIVTQEKLSQNNLTSGR
jgi:hypothetical protein